MSEDFKLSLDNIKTIIYIGLVLGSMLIGYISFTSETQHQIELLKIKLESMDREHTAHYSQIKARVDSLETELDDLRFKRKQ
jgi:hypothetical protein